MCVCVRGYYYFVCIRSLSVCANLTALLECFYLFHNFHVRIFQMIFAHKIYKKIEYCDRVLKEFLVKRFSQFSRNY